MRGKDVGIKPINNIEFSLGLRNGDSVIVSLDFYAHLAFVVGDSGMGASMVFNKLLGLYRLGKVSGVSSMLFFNSYFYEDIESLIKGARGCVVVIDNADIILKSDTLRSYIGKDKKNFYLIFGRNDRNLRVTDSSLSMLTNENGVIYLDYFLLGKGV